MIQYWGVRLVYVVSLCAAILLMLRGSLFLTDNVSYAGLIILPFSLIISHALLYGVLDRWWVD